MKGYTIFTGVNGVIDICDKINIYDNTEMLKIVMAIEKGKIEWKDKKIPGWLRNFFKSI
ncbi:hypothetical protein CcarbDRAFT_1812 [Clostridium carboxidivorans P7]|uniref:Uncharacterized protein n=1 Tax=Clostridium carboxidivorans P7 TaxID=536227 RepID=C6PSP5_9CLOT|nr:hypothetical protein [Clostridium carboxidivorans]EET87724.1 hypothetical protein CcarbDRAFT_1812 [Clostridium carboxidivorans P7]